SRSGRRAGGTPASRPGPAPSRPARRARRPHAPTCPPAPRPRPWSEILLSPYLKEQTCRVEPPGTGRSVLEQHAGHDARDPMNRLLAGIVLAVLVILGLPSIASAGQNDPYFSVPSTSYSGQPSKFSVRIINNLENSTLTASVSGSASGSMSCSPAGAISGL